MFHDDDHNACFESDNKTPTGKCPRGTITVTQADYYSIAEVTWNLEGLKPNNIHEGHVHWQGDWDLRKLYYSSEVEGPHMNPGMSEYHRADWSEMSLDERHMGDLTSIVADKYGNYKGTMKDAQLNLFGQWSIFGRMCDVHLPKGDRESDRNLDNDLPPFRAVSFGVFGRTGRYDEVPQWDLGPHPCFGEDESMPHGGKNKELCKIWKSPNNKFPDITVLSGFGEHEKFASRYELNRGELKRLRLL